MPSLPWKLAGALFLVHAGLVIDALRQPASPTFVLTPLVDVLPGGAVDAAEGAALQNGARLDVRTVQGAVARFGSTFSVDDLARAILALDDLTAAQKARLTTIVTAAKAQHDAAVKVQADILVAEAAVLRAADPVRALLPPEPPR